MGAALALGFPSSPANKPPSQVSKNERRGILFDIGSISWDES